MDTAVLFPGQGSQEPGMGRDLAESDNEIMEFWKKAERVSGLPLREIYWDGDEAQMAATANLQPGLTVVNLALWMRLSSKLSPKAAAGHSLGEYSALAAAGVLPVDTIIELVSLRGKLMSQADPEGKGAMAAALKISLPALEECVERTREETGKILVVANYNTPGQIVVSGEKDAIAHLQGVIKAAKGRALPLPVSGAFHSPLMQEAAAELDKALDAVKKTAWNKARFPIYSNATARGETAPEAIRAALSKQMTSSVRWIDTIRSQWDNGCRRFVECGPKGVLEKMVAPILKEHPAAAGGDSPAWTVVCVGNLEQLREFPG